MVYYVARRVSVRLITAIHMVVSHVLVLFINYKGVTMYGSLLGTSTAGVGALVLPNTGGNSMLTVAAITSIVVGCAILVTSLVRFVAVKSYQK